MKYLVLFLLLVGLPGRAIQPQEQQNWCWAACIQDVMAQAGVPIAQAKIVAQLSGTVADRPAGIDEVVAILQSFGFKAWQAGRPGTPAELYNSLASGWKLIAFVRPTQGPVGHFIVLQGIDPNSGLIITSDPWTAQTSLLPVNGLYAWWRWGDSVVVGRPM